jgi:hypothetical protein
MPKISKKKILLIFLLSFNLLFSFAPGVFADTGHSPAHADYNACAAHCPAGNGQAAIDCVTSCSAAFPGSAAAGAGNQVVNEVKKAAGGMFDMLITSLLELINGVLGAIVSWLGDIRDAIGAIMAAVLNYDNLIPPASETGHIVNLGWTNVLSVANMFFVIFLIIIAFSTILGIERYNYRSILWKLIVAALLINFSLVIAGVFVDFSQVLTNFFLEKIDEGGQLVDDTMSGTMGFEALYTPPEGMTVDSWAADITDLDVQYAMMLSNVLDIIFTIISIFVFCAFLVMFMVRIFAIWVLLILSPMAWVMWIFPNTESIWHRWWGSFIKWVSFAPIATFFIWLATKSTADMKAAFIANLDPSKVADSAVMQPWNNASNLEFIMQFALGTGLLIAALIVPQQMSITGAGAAVGILQRSKSKVTGYAKRGAGFVGSKTAEVAGRATGITATKERVSDYFASQKLIRQRESTERKEDRARIARGEEVPQESAYQRAKSGVKFDKMTQGLSETEKLEMAAKVSRGGKVEALEAKRKMAEADIEKPQKAADARKIAEVMVGIEAANKKGAGISADTAQVRIQQERAQMAIEKKRKDLVEEHGEGSDRVKRHDAEQLKSHDKKYGEAVTEMEKAEKKGYTLVMPTGDIVKGTGEGYKHYSEKEFNRNEEMRKEALMTPEEIQKKRESQMDVAKKEMIEDFQKRQPAQPDKEEIEWRGKKAGLTSDEIRDQIRLQKGRDSELRTASRESTAERDARVAKMMESAAREMKEAGHELKSLVENPEVTPPKPEIPVSRVSVPEDLVIRPVQTIENPEELPPATPTPPPPPPKP